MFWKERSRYLRVVKFEIRSRIFPSKGFFLRCRVSSREEVDELRTSTGPVRWFSSRLRYDKKGIVRREEGMAPEKWLRDRFRMERLVCYKKKKRMERLVIFCTSGKPPVSSLWSRYNSVSRLKLLNEEGTWPMKPLEERDKTSNLLRLPNPDESEEEVNLL